MVYRQLELNDLPKIMKLQELCFIDVFREPEQTYISKMKMFPKGCVGLFNVDLLGLLIYHPWNTNLDMPVGSLIDNLPEECDCLYLQEIAIHPEFRGQGIMKAFMDIYFDYFHNTNYNILRAVSVQRSLLKLARYGFQVIEAVEVNGQPAYKVEINVG